MVQKKSLNIHFVCLGNVYRSRFAESYARSKETPHVFTSSGIIAEANHFGPISWWGARLAYNAGVAPHVSPSWTQTSQSILDDADLVIFVHPQVEERSGQMFNLKNVEYKTWHIEDLLPLKTDVPEEQKEQESIRQSDIAGGRIVEHVDALLDELDQRTM